MAIYDKCDCIEIGLRAQLPFGQVRQNSPENKRNSSSLTALPMMHLLAWIMQDLQIKSSNSWAIVLSYTLVSTILSVYLMGKNMIVV